MENKVFDVIDARCNREVRYCVVKNFPHICVICFAWLSQDIVAITTNAAVLLYTRVHE